MEYVCRGDYTQNAGKGVQSQIAWSVVDNVAAIFRSYREGNPWCDNDGKISSDIKRQERAYRKTDTPDEYTFG